MSLFYWNKQGLTLIEVLIALALFTFVSFYLFRITDTMVQYRKKLTRNLNDSRFSRHALQVFRKDLSNMFFTQDINRLIYLRAVKRQKSTEELEKPANKDPKTVAGQLAQFKQNMYRTAFPRPLTISFIGGLIGKKDQIYLTSFSRSTESSLVGDQNTVMYYLKNCQNQKNKKTSLCLWRKSSSVIPNLEEMEKMATSSQHKTSTVKKQSAQSQSELVVLEGVKKFEISYYDISSNEWEDEWEIGMHERSLLPSAIRVLWEFEDSRKRIVKRQSTVTLHQGITLPAELTTQ